MSDDDGVGVHGLQVQDSVFKGFSFHSAAGIEIKIDDVRTQSFCGQLEGTAGARAGFKEEVDNCFSSQSRDFLDFSSGNFIEGFCCIEDSYYFRRSEVLYPEKMLVFEGQVCSPILSLEVR